jgi:hypothetical protein
LGRDAFASMISGKAVKRWGGANKGKEFRHGYDGRDLEFYLRRSNRDEKYSQFKLLQDFSLRSK